jgi:hypothetical protein
MVFLNKEASKFHQILYSTTKFAILKIVKHDSSIVLTPVFKFENFTIAIHKFLREYCKITFSIIIFQYLERIY